MEIRQVFAFNLKRLRREKQMSQEDLAHRADLDRTYVSALERSVYSASLDVLGRIADAFEIEAAELLRVPKA